MAPHPARPGAAEPRADRGLHVPEERLRILTAAPRRSCGGTARCALFNFYNRWIDATGVHALSTKAHREGATRSARHGYAR